MLKPAEWIQNWRAHRGLSSAEPYTQFLIASDGAGWVLDEESRELLEIAAKLGVSARSLARPRPGLKQNVHYASHFSLANPKVFRTLHHISVDYFHGKPDQGREFEQIFNQLKMHRDRISRVRISYSEMREVVRSAGIEESRIQQIPIGINASYFRWKTAADQVEARRSLEIPLDAFVIGSFQKDGSGWGDGMEPKWVKGPDVFLATIEKLKHEFVLNGGPELWVLLTGPARGFVKRGLERLGVPYRHRFLGDYRQVADFYPALDVYVVASREEGGPKSILESMVSGVPIVSTRVGQAIDLVQHGKNGWLSPVGDAADLARGVMDWIGKSAEQRNAQLEVGRETAQANTYSAQLPQWADFFRGIIHGMA